MSNQFKLTVESGTRTGQVLELAVGKTTLGRGGANDIVLDDPTISKHHLLFTVETDAVSVQDLGSTNGTFVNEQQITASKRLKSGDVLRIGADVLLKLSDAMDKTMYAAAPPTARKKGGAGWLIALIALLIIIALVAGGYFAWQGIKPVSPTPTTEQISAVEVTSTSTATSTFTPEPAADTPADTPIPQTRIVFNANQTTLQFGDCTRLTWSVDNAKDVRLDGETVPLTGERQACPQKSGENYILTALTAGGEIEEATISLAILPTATPLPGIEAAFSAEKNTLSYGDCTTLRWQVKNAKTVALNGEQVGATGSQEVCPREPSNTYRLLIASVAGGNTEQTVVVRVQPTPMPASTQTPPTPTFTPLPPAPATGQPSVAPVINQFIADSYSLKAGKCTLLHWSVSNARQVSLDDTPVANRGKQQICPATTGNYLLTAVGSGGQTAQATVQLQVGDASVTTTPPATNDGPYVLEVGAQHRYEEPWGGDRGDPCDGNFDDKNPNFRGFNLEMLLTNNSSAKVADDWGKHIRYFTAGGGEVKACYYSYSGAGPPPHETRSVTFFTVVPQGDYVQVVTLDLGGYTIRLCLDGKGESRRC